MDSEKIYELIEQIRKSGKLKKGLNEVTKAIEKGKAKMVVVAQDINPKEITMHIPLLCKEKGVPYYEVPKKDELGASAGMSVGTAAVAVVHEGDAKEIIKRLSAAKGE